MRPCVDFVRPTAARAQWKKRRTAGGRGDVLRGQDLRGRRRSRPARCGRSGQTPRQPTPTARGPAGPPASSTPSRLHVAALGRPAVFGREGTDDHGVGVDAGQRVGYLGPLARLGDGDLGADVGAVPEPAERRVVAARRRRRGRPGAPVAGRRRSARGAGTERVRPRARTSARRPPESATSNCSTPLPAVNWPTGLLPTRDAAPRCRLEVVRGRGEHVEVRELHGRPEQVDGRHR